MPPTSQTPQRRRASRVALIAAGFVGVLLVAAVIGRVWLRSYLHGPEFQKFIAARLGASLKAEVECLPFRFDGLTLRCDGLHARGYEGSAFSDARLTQVTARFNLRGFFRGVWTIEEFRAEALTVQLDGTRLTPPPSQPEQQRAEVRRHAPGLLPNRLELAGGKLDSLEIFWGATAERAGSFRKTNSLTFTHAGLGTAVWDLSLAGGDLTAAGLPPLNLREAKLSYRQKEAAIIVQSASFVAADGGSATASGEIRFGDAIDLQGQLTGIDLAPMLAGDWRMRLHGKMNGNIRVQSPLPAAGPPSVTGLLSLSEGRVEAFPVLNQIAAITRVQQFRDLPLSRASGSFHHEANRLEVVDLVAESAGRLRVEGGFKVDRGEIDGTFQVGVPPALLEWIPGAQERVFTTARDGYAWTPMRLTGPVEAPKEDLSERLVAAAGETVLQKLEETAGDAFQRGREAARSALDLLLPLVK